VQKPGGSQVNDVISDQEYQYCLAEVTETGYIYLNCEWMWHRESNLCQFDAKKYYTFAQAKRHTQGGLGEIIMCFTSEGVCESLWFTHEQHRLGIPKRLERFRTCYGGYNVMKYTPKGAIA
jgi:hypothetical protein